MDPRFSEYYSQILEKIVGYLIPVILGYGVIQLTKIRDEMSSMNATLSTALVRINEHDRRLDAQALQMLRLEDKLFGEKR